MADVTGALYGRAGAIGLVARFLTRPLGEDGVPRSRQIPVLVFTGPRAVGKTALLEELARQLDQVVPFAWMDCETGPTVTRELLSALVFELNRRCGSYGTLPFPRFITGQLIIAQKLTLTNRDKARDEVDQVLQEYRNIDKLRKFLSDFAPRLLAAVPGVQGIPGVDAAGRYLPGLVLKGLVSGRWGRRIVLGSGPDWYGHQDRGLGRKPQEALVDLNSWAADWKVAANRRRVNNLLWAAFLADLRHAFRDSRRADEWSGNCVVLMDNVDAEAGLNFLEGLVRARQPHAAHGDDFDPLTVVATSRGDLSARVVAAGDSIPDMDAASYDDYRQRMTGRQDRGWYPVMLNDLTEDDVDSMLAAQEPHLGFEPHATRTIYNFTAGHPGSTRVVLDAVRARSGAEVDLRAVLDMPISQPLGPDSDTPSVREHLLEQFLQDVPDAAVDDLVSCAAARDLAQASRLATHSELLQRSTRGNAAPFAPRLWTMNASTDTATMVPVLRRLLLERLVTRLDDQPDSWSGVHRWLRDDRRDAGDETGEFYHALALGELEQVTRRLAESLPRVHGAMWLELLQGVTAAPNRLDLCADPMSELKRCTKWAERQPAPLRALAGLVAALWIDADPLSDNHRRSRANLYLEIAAGFDAIAPDSSNGRAVLRAQAERYRRKAAELE